MDYNKVDNLFDWNKKPHEATIKDLNVENLYYLIAELIDEINILKYKLNEKD